MGLGASGDRADADVLAVEHLQPGGQRPTGERRRELACEGFLVGLVVPLSEVRSTHQVAEQCAELRFEGGDGQIPAVRRFVDAVARDAAGEQPGTGWPS